MPTTFLVDIAADLIFLRLFGVILLLSGPFGRFQPLVSRVFMAEVSATSLIVLSE